jgi:hypothetical protein
MHFIGAAAMNVSIPRSARSERRGRMAAAAIVTLLGLAAVSTSARADTLTTFNFSGTLDGSPNSNPATVTGTFTLDQTTGTLAGVYLMTPIGTFAGSSFDVVETSAVQTTSGGPAIRLIYAVDGGVVPLLLIRGNGGRFHRWESASPDQLFTTG